MSVPVRRANDDHVPAPTFVPGLVLNAAFYREIVAPLLASRPHAAALLGWGSDVLGYDTPRSTDHGWGPRLQLFVTESEVDAVAEVVHSGLPTSFQGVPVRYGWDERPQRHHVEVTTLARWLVGAIGVDPRDGMVPADWLAVPQQLLLGVVRGAVYADPQGELTHVRRLLAWYPHDVWLWLLASQWCRITQEHAFVGRTAEVGDELGSRLVASRLARELMRLVFLQERQYWPYLKWFGTSFARLPVPSELVAAFHRVSAAADHPSREEALCDAYRLLADRHNALGLTDEVDTAIGPYYSRPFRVLHGDFAGACQAAVTDPTLRDLPLVGSIDQFVDSTDVLSDAARARALRGFYASLSSPAR